MKAGRRKALSFALAFTVFVSMVFAQFALGGGEAYAAHWAASYISKLASKNVMRGDEYGNYNPDRNITRAEFAAMLNRAFGFEENKGKKFSDVPVDAWFADDISFASYQGYFQGPGGGLADPYGNLTREEAVTLLCRAIKIEPAPVDTLQFADSRDFASWSRGYINAATAKGILSGYNDDTFRPGNPITRGEVAKLIATAAGEIVNQPTQAYLGYVNGNVTLSKSGAGLRDTVITGDLYITEGVLSGFVFLENVTVLGDIIISGAGESNEGESSIIMTNCDVNNIIIDLNHNKRVSVITQGNTEIRNTVVKSNAYLEEDNTRGTAFNDIQVNGPVGTRLDLSGEFAEVRIMAPGNEVRLNKGSIDKFVSDEDAAGAKLFLEKNTTLGELYVDGSVTVTGTGKIEFVQIGANGANIAQVPDEIHIKPGYTAVIGGKVMDYLQAEMENMTPRIESGYPTVQDVTVNSASGLVKANKPGTIYWAVKEQGGDIPTEAEMKDPKKGDTFILQSGNLPLNIKAIDDDTELAAKIAGLKNGGDYDLYVMLVDSKGKASRVRYIDFETLDKTSPAFLSGYPKGKAVYVDTPTAMHSLQFDIVPTKDCTVYWAMLPDKFAAPTQENFYNEKVAGVVEIGGTRYQGTLSASQNQISTLDIKGLPENTPYDVYIGLKDARGNVSNIVKTSIRTKDVTPPEFEKPYPLVGIPTEKTIEIQYMVNKDAVVLYWALYKHGANFPPGAPPQETTGPAITTILASEDAQRAVVRGSTALKYGNVKIAAAQRPGLFTISSLDAHTLYDLYMVLEDSSGNRNVVYKMEVSTLDNVPPKAYMQFEEAVQIGDNPPVGSDVMIRFDKSVYAGFESAKTPLKDLDKAKLADYFKLYDIGKDPKEPVPIDFSNVKFLEDRGYTVVIFPTTGVGTPSDSAALELESGGKYQFEIVYPGIVDFSGNIMEYTNVLQGGDRVTRLAPFTMKSPYVTIKNVNVESPYDVLFEVDPQISDAAPNQRFELVFETSAPITFNIYEITPPPPGVVSVGDSETLIGSDITIEAGKYFYPLQSLLPSGSVNTAPPFNGMEKKRYGIEITAVDGNATRASWDGSLTFSVRGVAATLDGLTALTFWGTDPNTDYNEFKQGVYSSEVSDASDPTKFDRIIFFRDTTPPEFLQTSFDSGDTTIQMSVVLDKPATVYWLAVPVGSVPSGIDPEATPTAVLSANQLISGSYRPTGYVSSKFDVPSANARTDDFIRGLKPEPEKYYVFYLARANVASELKCKLVEMQPVIIPAFANGYPMGGAPGVKSATTITKLAVGSPDAVVYWAAYRVGVWTDSEPDARTISQASQTGAGGGDTRMASWGSFTLTGGASPPEYTATVSNLLEGIYYDVFFVARNPMSDPTTDEWTAVYRIDHPLTPIDPTPPVIWPGTTGFTQLPAPGDTISRFGGSIRIDFSKPLYYKTSPTGAARPLTSDILTVGAAGNLSCSIGDINIGSITSETGNPSTSPINGFTIYFANVVNGSVISLPFLLGDGVNDAGYFKMTFVRNAADPEASEWRVEFVTRL